MEGYNPPPALDTGVTLVLTAGRSVVHCAGSTMPLDSTKEGIRNGIRDRKVGLIHGHLPPTLARVRVRRNTLTLRRPDAETGRFSAS